MGGTARVLQLDFPVTGLGLNLVRIWGQCCWYICVMFSSAKIRLEGMRTGSSSRLEPAVVADGCGAELILGITVFLDLFAAGAFDVFAVLRLRDEVAG